MLMYARKKQLRDDRLLQLVLLLSLLRSAPDLLLTPSDLPDLLLQEHDLILGSSLGQALGGPSLLQELGRVGHPKSLDRLLQDRQRDVLNDLHALGRYATPTRLHDHAHDHHPQDIHAYLLNAPAAPTGLGPLLGDGGPLLGEPVSPPPLPDTPPPEPIPGDLTDEVSWTHRGRSKNQFKRI